MSYDFLIFEIFIRKKIENIDLQILPKNDFPPTLSTYPAPQQQSAEIFNHICLVLHQLKHPSIKRYPCFVACVRKTLSKSEKTIISSFVLTSAKISNGCIFQTKTMRGLKVGEVYIREANLSPNKITPKLVTLMSQDFSNLLGS